MPATNRNRQTSSSSGYLSSLALLSNNNNNNNNRNNTVSKMAKKKKASSSSSSSSAAKSDNKSDSASEVNSLASEESQQQNEDAHVEAQTADQKFDELLESLSEKRASTRITAINKLTELFTSSFVKQELSTRQETLCNYLLSSIRKGATDEVVPACRLLSLAIITMGEEGEILFSNFANQLQSYIQDPKNSAASRTAAVQTLALLYFISCFSEGDTKNVMSLLTDIAFKIKSTKTVDFSLLISEALQAWGLLATTLNTASLASYKHFLSQLHELLESESVDVRMSAGENIALLYTATVQQSAVEAEEKEQLIMEQRKKRSDSFSVESSTTPLLSPLATPNNNQTSAPQQPLPVLTLSSPASTQQPQQPQQPQQAKPQQPQQVKPQPQQSKPQKQETKVEQKHIEDDEHHHHDEDEDHHNGTHQNGDHKTHSSSAVDMDDIVETLHQLSTDGSRYRAKKDRVRQRAIFRDILRTVEEGELPSETLTIGSEKHYFEGWADLRRLDALRECLGSGLQLHFAENHMLADIFGLDFFPSAGQGANGDTNVADEIRAMKKENKMYAKLKARSQHEFNTKQRRKKTAALFSGF